MRFVLPTLYDTRGGSTRVLLATAEALRAAHEVRVRAPLPEADDRAAPSFPSQPLAGPWLKLAALPRVAALVARETAYLRRARPDVVWVHDEPSLYVYGLAARALRPRPRIVWHLHMTAGTGATRRLRLALADRIVTPSRREASGIPGATVLRNPVRMPPEAVATATPLTVTVVAALTPRKNAGLALDVLAELPREARLTLVGPALDSAYAADLQARAHAFGGRAVLVGERRADALWDGVQGVVLFPSLLENQPLALVEAIAAGLPVAATDIPAHRAIAEDVGLDPACLASPEPRTLARAVGRAAARGPDLAAAARARDLFAPERFAEGVRALARGLQAARFASASP